MVWTESISDACVFISALLRSKPTLKKHQAQLVKQENLSNATIMRIKAELEAGLQLLANKKSSGC